MGIEECKLAIRSVFTPEELSDRELQSIVDEAVDIKKNNPLDFDALTMQLAQKRMLEKKESAFGKLMEVKRTRDLIQHLTAMPDEKFNAIQKKMGLDNQRLSKLDALLTGRARGGAGANAHVDSYQTAFNARLGNPVKDVIEKMGITHEELVGQAFDLDVGTELYHLNKGKPGFATTNVKAQALAKVYRESTFKDMRSIISAGGKDVGYLDNYAGWRRYDREKVAANKEAFITSLLSDDVSPNTFDPGASPENKRARAEKAWTHIVYGNQGDFTKHRSIHFNEYAGEQAFLKQFGYFDNHYQSTQAQIQTVGKIAGLMKVFGPNYRETFDKLVKWADPSGSGGHVVKNTFADLSGELSNVHETPWSKAAATIRSYTSLRSLWNSSITAFLPDQVSAAALAGTVDGRGTFSAMHSTVANYIKTANKADRRKFADLMMLNSFDLVSTYSDNAQVGLNGKLSQYVSTMFKWNRLASHSDRMRTSLATTIGSILHDHVEQEFIALPKQLQETFARYNINADNWNALRQGVVGVHQDMKILSPKAVLENVKGKVSEDTFIKVSGMINDYAKLSTLEGSAYSRQVLYWGQREGTPVGELMRFIGQFKQAGVNMMRLQGRLAHSMPLSSYAQALSMFTVAGYLSYMAREVVVNGVTPAMPDIDTAEGKKQLIMIIADSMNKGAGGLIGDTMTAPYNQSYRTLTGDIMGPAFNDANRLMKFSSGAIRGENKTNASEEMNFAQGLIPGSNAAFIKPLLQGLVMDNLHNMSNSQYEMNVKRKLRKRGQQRIKDLL